MASARRERYAAWLAANPAESAWRIAFGDMVELLKGATVTDVEVVEDGMFEGSARMLRLNVEPRGGGRAFLLIDIGPTGLLTPKSAGRPPLYEGERDWFTDEANEQVEEVIYDYDIGLVIMPFDDGDNPAWDNAEDVCIPGYDRAFFDSDEADDEDEDDTEGRHVA